jgi:RNA chaperone Hfq
MNERTLDQAVREEQLSHGREMARTEGTLTLPPRNTSPGRPERRPGNAKTQGKPTGHEAFLKALETSGAQIGVVFLDGKTVEGVVKHSDKFTISLEATLTGHTHVIFKHAICSFKALSPRPVGETLQ